MAKSTLLSNAILDVTLANDGTGDLTAIGDLTIVLPVRCTFNSSLGDPDNPGTEWPPSAAGYVQGGVSMENAYTVAASGGTKTNSAAVIVTNCPATLWAGNEIVDSSSPFQRLHYGPDQSLNRIVNAGDTCVIPIGSLINQEF